MERLAEHRFARAIASRVAFRMHPKPAHAAFVPPVIVRAGGRASLFINADSRYADSMDGDVLRYRASVNPVYNNALKRLAEARASVDIVALINKKFYVAKGILSRTALAGFSGFDVRLVD